MSRRLALAVLPALALTATAAGAQAPLAAGTDIGVVDAGYMPAGPGSLSLDGRAFTNAFQDAQAPVIEGLARENGIKVGAAAQTRAARGTEGRTAAVTARKFGRLPEPATWLMLIMGFGLIGGVIRRGLRKSDERFNAYIRSITEDADA